MRQTLMFEEPSSAVLSEDGIYRYMLSRRWALHGPTISFICLNPSTADATVDDQTVRKCVRFAKKWGGAQLLIGNLFAFRSTDPRGLKIAADPIGQENDHWLEQIARTSDLLVAAWGAHGSLLGRDVEVMTKLNGRLNALRLTKDGAPSHPLYLPETLTPFKL
jgi:hypothetical protein